MPIPSRAVRLARPYPGAPAGCDESALSRRLRVGETSVVARVRDGAVWLDQRAVFAEEDDAIVAALSRLATTVD
jgi:hypothetical protein